MSDRSRKLTKVGMGPAVADTGKVPKFRSVRVACPAPASAPQPKEAITERREDDASLAYRPTVPAPPVSTPPASRKTAAYDSFVDASEKEVNISDVPRAKSDPVKSDPARAPRTSVRRTEPPPAPNDSTPPPRSAKISVRTGREAISVDEVGPSSRSQASLPPGARPRVAPRKKGAPSPPLNGRDAHVLVLVNGVRTVKEIVDASKLRPSETAMSLQKLVRVGVILF